MSDRSATALLFACSLLVYAYFFQGYGFNQNAHFDTVRALVERHSFEISPYTSDMRDDTFTGDIATFHGRVYSHKPPGLPLACAPVYAAALAVERAVARDPGAPGVVQFNLYLLTLWGSALPASLLVAGMYRYLRRTLRAGDAMILAAALAFGSMLLPYSGLLMVHVAVAAQLFFAWRLLARPGAGAGSAAAAGLLAGAAILFDLSVAPIAALLLLLAVPRRVRVIVAFCAGPAVAVGAMMLYQWALFGNAFKPPHEYQIAEYTDPHLLLGHFGWPDPRRLYWLSFHPLRGVFYLTPVLLLPVLSLLVARPTWAAARRAAVPLAVIGYLVLLNLTFHGWTGGFGAGPRYLIPAVPFLFILARPAYLRFGRLAALLIAISCVNMLVVTAVRAQFPANTFGPPVAENPVAECLKRFTMNQLAHDKGSFNLAMLAAGKGRWTILPPLAVMAVPFTVGLRLRGAGSTARS